MANITLRPSSLTEFGLALRAARQAQSLTLDALAAKTAISKPYLSNIETARTPGPPSPQKLRSLAKSLNLRQDELLAAADWLRTPLSIRRSLATSADTPHRPDGTINLDLLIASPNPLAAPASADAPRDSLPLAQIPLINRVAAGTPGEFGDLAYPAGIADAYVAAPDLPDAPAAALFALRVTGDSMLPEYRAGDILIVGPGDPKDGDDCVIRTGPADNFATTFKRIFFLKDAAGTPASARLVPLNPAHPERIVLLADITGIYPLVYRIIPARTAKSAAIKASEKLKALRD